MRSALAVSALVCAACGSAPPAGGADDDAAAPPVVDAPPDAEPCGQRNGERGLTQREVTVDGVRRTYLVYLPPGAGATPLPLVFVFHGYTMSGQKMVDATRYTELADDEGIALAFPDGQGGPDSLGAPWNVGTGVCPSFGGPPPVGMGDDFAFVDAIRADVSADQCIDRAHVFATGFSMGGYFTHQIACKRTDFAGAAPHSGGTHDLAGCDARPVPILILHGAADPVIPNGCDDPGAVPVGRAQRLRDHDHDPRRPGRLVHSLRRLPGDGPGRDVHVRGDGPLLGRRQRERAAVHVPDLRELDAPPVGVLEAARLVSAAYAPHA
jgi:poly(3-hydroxybutyrate) depolymerase